MVKRIGIRPLVIVVALVLLVATFFVLRPSTKMQTVTAHFSRAVSVYKGSEVRVMGVRIGTVKAVVPEGDTVRVVMEYDSEYKLPAEAKAAVVTPTLVADRFVQIAPAYTEGPALKDKADINLKDTGTPVELDRIYQSLLQLTQALGPNGANKDGSLNRLLAAGSTALEGNGELGNEAVTNLALAVQTLGDNSDSMFDSVDNLSQLTETLAANDEVVNQFMGDLAAVSSSLAGDRDNLKAALAALARAMGTVRTFVRDNREMLRTDIEQLTDVLDALAKESESLNTLSKVGALGMGNLNIAFDTKSGSIGSRVQFGPYGDNLGNILCDTVQNSGISNAAYACDLLKAVTAPIQKALPDLGAGFTPPQLKLGGTKPPQSLGELLGSLQQGARR